MIGVVRLIRRIQLEKISYSPKLFTAIKTTEIKHPTEYDESDDIERTKTIKKKKWGDTTINTE